MNLHCLYCNRVVRKSQPQGITNGQRVYHLACRGAKSRVAHGGGENATSAATTTTPRRSDVVAHMGATDSERRGRVTTALSALGTKEQRQESGSLGAVSAR